MDDSELINEVLGLTLACQRGEATPEEHARLERLLADNPQAIVWYLRVVDDTLTLLDASAAKETAAASNVADSSPEDPAAADQPATVNLSPTRRSPRSWLALLAVTC